MKKQPVQGPIGSITIILIATDAAGTLEATLKSARKIASSHTDTVQLMVVDNGSTDNTAKVLADFKKKFKKLEIITLRKAMSTGDAFLSAVAKIKGEWFVYTHADDRYDIRDLAALLKEASHDIDVVNGLRELPKKSVKTLKTTLRNQFIKKVFILPIKDIASDFKLIRTSLFKSAMYRHIEKDFHKELMVKLKSRKARFKEVSVKYMPPVDPIVDVDELKESLGSFRRKMRFIDSVKLS